MSPAAAAGHSRRRRLVGPAPPASRVVGPAPHLLIRLVLPVAGSPSTSTFITMSPDISSEPRACDNRRATAGAVGAAPAAAGEGTTSRRLCRRDGRELSRAGGTVHARDRSRPRLSRPFGVSGSASWLRPSTEVDVEAAERGMKARSFVSPSAAGLVGPFKPVVPCSLRGPPTPLSRCRHRRRRRRIRARGTPPRRAPRLGHCRGGAH